MSREQNQLDELEGMAIMQGAAAVVETAGSLYAGYRAVRALHSGFRGEGGFIKATGNLVACAALGSCATLNTLQAVESVAEAQRLRMQMDSATSA